MLMEMLSIFSSAHFTWMIDLSASLTVSFPRISLPLQYKICLEGSIPVSSSIFWLSFSKFYSDGTLILKDFEFTNLK